MRTRVVTVALLLLVALQRWERPPADSDRPRVFPPYSVGQWRGEGYMRPPVLAESGFPFTDTQLQGFRNLNKNPRDTALDPMERRNAREDDNPTAWLANFIFGLSVLFAVAAFSECVCVVRETREEPPPSATTPDEAR